MIYHIQYLHIMGLRHLTTEDIIKFSELLDTAIEDEYISNETIKIYTEEK